MPYRSDEQARSDRREALSNSLREVDHRLRELEPLSERRQQLAGQIEQLEREAERERHRAVLPILEQIKIRTPCKESWRLMKGDDRVRFCDRCESHVFNLSAMTHSAAADLISSTPNACVRFMRRPDDTIVFGQCRDRRPDTDRTGLTLLLVALAAAFLWVIGSNLDRWTGDRLEMGGMEHMPAPPAPEPPPRL